MLRTILTLGLFAICSNLAPAHAQSITVLRSFPSGLTGIVLNGNDIYVTGNLHGVPPPQLGKFSTTGQQYWERTFTVPSATYATGIGPADSSGGLAVTATGIYVA